MLHLYINNRSLFCQNLIFLVSVCLSLSSFISRSHSSQYTHNPKNKNKPSKSTPVPPIMSTGSPCTDCKKRMRTLSIECGSKSLYIYIRKV
ncbi:uncharacterized protein K441DRAFT_52602 [Cenococcum geophilum 1.58]|uniref:uncharacterized protein n=1 Tax=Cenococcum geophilum 1.58 TaxID=794803 RepID=UPI00358F4953|nr:hypothetical protein K441DRAFT_52602 [Cenococcum geophilum 1.58]